MSNGGISGVNNWPDRAGSPGIWSVNDVQQGRLSGAWPIAQVVFLCHMDGANGSTSFTDTRGHAITTNGNAQVSTAQSVFGGASAVFDGTGDYLSLSDSDDWYYPNDFTIECRTRITTQPVSGTGSMSLQMLYSQRATDVSRIFLGYADWTGVTTGKGLWFQINNDAASVSLIYNTTLTTNQWYTIAVTRSGNTFRLFIDGAVVASTTNSIAFPNVSSSLNIGFGWTNSFYLFGYLDEYRITNGIAQYTGNYSPATAQFED